MTNPNLAYEFLTGLPPRPALTRTVRALHKPSALLAWLHRLAARRRPLSQRA